MYWLVDLAHLIHAIATHPITTHGHIQVHVVLYMLMGVPLPINHPQSPFIYVLIPIQYGTPVFRTQLMTYMYDHWCSQTPQLDL